MYKFATLLFTLLIIGTAYSQQESLQVEREEIITQINAFGVEEQLLVGNIINMGEMAYENVQVYADLINADGEVIGEGFGFLADQCGVAITDAALQPNQQRQFLATIDLFGEGDIETIEIFPEGTAIDPEPPLDRDVDDAVQRVAGGEVVSVEWEDNSILRYGIGCESEIFTTYDWYRYNMRGETITPLDESPNEAFITDAFLLQTGINQITQSGETDPTLIDTSYLTFPTQSQRIVYQTDINTVITAEVDGSFKRIVHTVLSQYSLQGYVWSPDGNFAATYFGAYGEPVQYFTASAQANRISALLTQNTPSQTIPGITNDGRSVIIGGTFENNEGEEVTGYWLSSVISQQRELLYEVDELPGNNYPAPAYHRVDAQTRHIYVVRPVDGVPVLECFFREEGVLTTLTELPLQLDIDERAWTFLSPDNSTLAIAANGDHGGLWLVDLEAIGGCGGA